jgi:hypothetical protein
MRTVKSDVSRVTPVSMRALAIQQSRESMVPATPVKDDRSFGSGVLTGVLGFFVKTGLTLTTPQGWDQLFSAPVTLTKAGYQAALHPVLTYDAVSRAFTKFYNSSSYHKGEVTGEILGAIGLAAATSGGGGAIGLEEEALELAPLATEISTEEATAITASQVAGGEDEELISQGISPPVEENVAQIDAGKFDYLFGKAKGLKNIEHNAPRSAQNAGQLIKRLGVMDNEVGRQLLQNHFDAVVRDGANVVETFTNQYGTYEVRESLFAGPSGQFAKFRSTWEILSDGTRRLTSVEPYGGR